MNSEITQGSIITYLRSLKYPQIRCFGIVISARCDLAHEKIKSIYLLTALPLHIWLEQVLFYDMLEVNLKEVYSQIKSYAAQNKLDFASLLDFGPDKALKCLEKTVAPKSKNKVETLCRKWDRLCQYRISEITPKEKRSLIAHNSKYLESQLKMLQNGSHTKYCFIPQKAYEKSGVSLTDGLVVDLYDIQQVEMRHKESILSGKYDYQTLTDEELRHELNEKFFFASPEDYIIMLYQIKSPWVEYLVQHFANAFSRIGVENANEDEIVDFCKKYCTLEEEQDEILII